jgi:hypothetical protein
MKTMCEGRSMSGSRFFIALGVILCLMVASVITLIPGNSAQAQLAGDAP